MSRNPQPQALPRGQRVFTCGHSFHVWVADVLREMAHAAGLRGHRLVGLSSIGGSRVIQHWNVPPRRNEARKALRAGRVDVLTLSPIWLPDAGIERFARLALQYNPSTRVTVQEYWLPNDEYQPVYPLQTWKKVDHDAVRLPKLRKHHQRYFRDMDALVRDLNRRLGRESVFVVPCGQAVLALREKILEGRAPGLRTQAELFTDSWGHPGPPVKALAGYCHFSVIYRRNPVGLPPPALLAANPRWGARLNRLLQQLAWEAATSHPLGGLRAGRENQAGATRSRNSFAKARSKRA